MSGLRYDDEEGSGISETASSCSMTSESFGEGTCKARYGFPGQQRQSVRTPAIQQTKFPRTRP